MASTSSTSRLKSFLISMGILSIGIVGLIALIGLRPDPVKEERQEFAPVVQIITVQESSGMVTVSGSGSVQPLQETNVSAEVPGRVIWVSPSFVAGGQFQEGDVMVRLDSTDFVNAVAIAEAEVTGRRYDLTIAQEESKIAREEWERLRARDEGLQEPEGGALGRLVFREPQMKLAEAALGAAEARLSDARTRLARTIVRAPFNGRIRAKSAAVGQYVAPGQMIAGFYATDSVEIVVPLRSEDAALIQDIYASRAGSPIRALVHATGGAEASVWTGKVARTEGALDPATRSLRVVVQVDRPYVGSSTRPPLLVGTFVDVAIDARKLDSFFEIPGLAVRDGGQVWVVTDGVLEFRPIQILTERGENVLVTSGLAEGETVVVSSLGVVTDGMKVSTVDAK
jgi:RND family efflux transporter MFP subunit